MRHEFRDFERRRDNRSSPLERTTRKLVGTGTALAGARPSKPTGFHGTSGAIQLGADSDLLHAPGATVTGRSGLARIGRSRGPSAGACPRRSPGWCLAPTETGSGALRSPRTSGSRTSAWTRSSASGRTSWTCSTRRCDAWTAASGGQIGGRTKSTACPGARTPCPWDVR